MPEPRAAKRDWNAAWRNWVRRVPEFAPNNRGSATDAWDRLGSRGGSVSAAAQRELDKLERMEGSLTISSTALGPIIDQPAGHWWQTGSTTRSSNW
jgi:hypothetical protein